MLQLGKKVKGKHKYTTVTQGMTVWIGDKFKYTVSRSCGDEYFLCSDNSEGKVGPNDKVFEYLGMNGSAAKIAWCQSRGIEPIRNGLFPYFTGENLLKIIDELDLAVREKQARTRKHDNIR